MNAETRAVVDAILEALDIPYAATVGHDETRTEILNRRLVHTVVALRHLADTEFPADLGRSLAFLREQLAEHPPVGYVTHEEARRRVAEGATWAKAVTASSSRNRDTNPTTTLRDEETGR